MKRTLARGALWTAAGLIGLLVVIQLVPYGRDHTNPPVRQEPPWDSAGTRALAVRACFDCHSNETVWPWYAHVAPISWLIQYDVHEGRRVLNYSEWDRPQEEAAESADSVVEGEMPPLYYSLIRPDRRLTAAEREALIRGLRATFGPGERERERGRRSRE